MIRSAAVHIILHMVEKGLPVRCRKLTISERADFGVLSDTKKYKHERDVPGVA